MVIKPPIKDNAFSYGVLVIGNEVKETNDVKHEYGHYLQFKELGIVDYTKHIAIPSLKGYWSGVSYEDYYSQPWEYGADLYGGVDRGASYYNKGTEENYKIYWDSITN